MASDEIPIYRNGERCATIERSDKGTIFRYDPEFGSTNLPGGGIAVSLPRDQERFTPGAFLPAFFENLLPEGFRSEAIRMRRHIAVGDGFGMLKEVGQDTIGDISTNSEPPKIRARLRSQSRYEAEDFDQLLEIDLSGNSTVPGVQPKLSDERITIVREGREIVKLAPRNFPNLVENEALVMEIAKSDCKIPTATTRIVQDAKGQRALAVQRFDRTSKGIGLHQEDGCQLLDVYPGEKYGQSFRDLLERARNVSPAPTIVSLRWLEIWAFSYLIGNSDLHLKNFSLFQVRTESGLLPTPAYDLVSTMVYPKHKEEMAIKMEGKANRFKMSDFVSFFGRYDLEERTVERTVREMAQRIDCRLEDLRSVAPEPKDGERAIGLLRQRADRL